MRKELQISCFSWYLIKTWSIPCFLPHGLLAYGVKLVSFFIIGLFLATSTPSFSEENFVDQEGYKYIFKESVGIDGSKIVALETFAPGLSDLLTRIPDIPPDSCSAPTFRSIEKLPLNFGKKYISICRNDSGRSQTLYIMSNGILISKIFFDSSEPNLMWDGTLGLFVAKSYPRFLNNFGSLAPFLVMYVWNPVVPLDSEAHAIFHESASNYYYDYYSALKTDIIKDISKGQYLLAPLVAALVSASSQKLICKEITTEPLISLTKNQLENYIDFVSTYGFPKFNINQCNGDI